MNRRAGAQRPGESALPPLVRYAGCIVLAEGLAALVYAAIVIYHTVGGAAEEGISNGFGFASWFILIGIGILVGGWALVTGRRWGRGIGVFTNLILLGVAWYAGISSHRPEFGIPVAVVAVAVLSLLFSKPASRWMTGAQ